MFKWYYYDFFKSLQVSDLEKSSVSKDPEPVILVIPQEVKDMVAGLQSGPYLEILIDRCKFDNLQENCMKK